MTDAKNPLLALSKSFAVEMIRLYDSLKRRGGTFALINQLLKCATSIGANVHEANYASSKPDFINKLQIALKECYETDYWLDILFESGTLVSDEHKAASDKCSRIRRMLISSINTAKGNLQDHTERKE